MNKREIKKVLKSGFVTPKQLRDIHESTNLSKLLTDAEIKRLNEIFSKMMIQNDNIELTPDQKRELLKYLMNSEVKPLQNEYSNMFDLDLLSEEEQQCLIDISIKLEQTMQL